jgi:predicted Zn-dependent protease with MMP-like domain
MTDTGTERSFTTPPSLDEIALLAERALAAIPIALARHLRGVGITVEQRADDATLDEVGLESSWDLTGLYRGTPLPERSVDNIARQPDLIVLYREAILLEWIESEEELFRLVRNVVVHEVAHHFGFSDDSIAALEEEMDERDAPDA